MRLLSSIPLTILTNRLYSWRAVKPFIFHSRFLTTAWIRERLEQAINSRTRLIIINSPHNPCGSILNKADLDKLAALIRDYDILILSDEVYEHMVFDSEKHESVLAHSELRTKSFVVSSFGKTYHATGWKLAYCVAPEKLTTEFRKVHQYVTFTNF